MFRPPPSSPLFPYTTLFRSVWAVPDAVGEDTSRRFLWATVAFVPLIILEIYLLYLAQADYAFVVTNTSMLLAPAVAFTGNAVFALTDTLTVRNAVAVWLAGQVEIGR